MLDIKKYIVNGRVEREKIAMDIKYLTITKNDLDILISNKEIREAFVGNEFSDKIPKSKWDKEYLDKLSYAVVAEGFNAEYLYYLNEVAEYVNKKRGNSKLIIGSTIVVVFIIILVLIYYLNKSHIKQ